jgi:hypothetical protein
MWIITKDYLMDSDTPSRVGVHSGDYKAETFRSLPTVGVRLLDDDDEIYYYLDTIKF